MPDIRTFGSELPSLQSPRMVPYDGPAAVSRRGISGRQANSVREAILFADVL